MKKILLAATVLFMALSVFSCTKKAEPAGDGEDKSDSVQADNGSATDEKLSDMFGDNTPQSADTEAASTADNQNDGENENKDDDEDDKEDNNSVTFAHAEEEILAIKERYIEAEDLYYTILYQKFNIGTEDTIIVQENGYTTEYQRMQYEDDYIDSVNSIEELKDKVYRPYFTESFISSMDFSIYREESGKLYCAATENSNPAPGAHYTYTVESIDENTVNVIRAKSDGSGAQKIRAIKVGAEWYFEGVAIN